MSNPTTAETPTMHHESCMDSGKTFCRLCGAVEGTDAWAEGVCPGWDPKSWGAAAETPTMREQLARACFEVTCSQMGWDNTTPELREYWAAYVDAILREMLEPSEGMLDAARDWSLAKYGRGVGNDGATGCLQAMIQHILNETKD